MVQRCLIAWLSFTSQWVQRYLIVWLSLSSLLAYVWPDLAPGLADPFVASKPLLSWLIGVTMFAIGWMLPEEEVRQVFRRWPTVLGGTTIQYTTMPLLAYGFGHLFGLEGPTLIGVVMVGCVPGAMASNVLTLNARGNVSYSVSLTTMATLLSPLVVPLALKLALGEAVSAELLRNVVYMLVLTVVLPVVAGHGFRRCFPKCQTHAGSIGSLVANLTILWIIAYVVGDNRGHLAQLSGNFVVPLLLINGFGYLAGYGGGLLMRLPDPMRRALTLEIGMQNAGVGTWLATQLFDEPEAAIPPALYTFGCMLTGTVLARAWAFYGERQEE